MCAAASTCRKWRQAVQQSGTHACNTAVQLSYSAPLPRLRSFVHWLSKHAPLVSSISIQPPMFSPSVDGLPWQRHLEAAQQLLQPAIAAAGQDGREPLKNISSIHVIGDTGMLAALPAHSLTNLDVRSGLLGPVDGQAASAALARLSNLQQLRLRTDSTDLYSCLAGLAQLSQLTSLELEHYARQASQAGDPQQLQQLLAQPLPLRVLHLHIGGSELPQLDMSNLTQLQVFSSWSQLDATFPPQLQQLTLGGISTEQQVEAVLKLQQLQRLKFDVCLPQPQLLARLAQLPALQHLVLQYNYRVSEAAATASAWQQLPALRELDLDFEGEEASMQDWEAILNGLAAATSVTRLDVRAAAAKVPDELGDEAGALQAGTVEACAQIARLTNLRELCIYDDSRIVPGGALALTALTGLTRLELGDACDGVGDFAATAIAGSCKQLFHLDLRDCGLLSTGCLANVRHLTQLTELQLDHNHRMRLSQQALMQLTGLTRLQTVAIDRNTEVTNEVVDHFWAVLRGQQQQQ
jgi:hypothetical protein